MTPKNFNWTTAEGLKIYAVEWPVENARAVIGLIHGVGEHCRRYDHLAAFFGEHGIATVGYDRQGYGRSEGKKGYAAKFSYYLDEVAKLLIECERRYPDRPVFLYGQSLGGGILLRYLIRRNPDLAGAIASSPHVRLAFTPPAVKVAMGRVMKSIWPTFTQETDLDLDQLSRSSGLAETYANDPYNHAKISARTGMDILDAANFLDEYGGTISVPLLLMHGSEDGITNFSATKEFSERIEGPDVTFRDWPGFYHELHNEPEWKEVLGFVLSWLEPRIAGAKSFRKLKSV